MKRSITITLLSALLLTSYTALPSQAAAATVKSADATGYIVSGVNFRDEPSVSGKVIGFLNKGSEVAVLDQSNKYFYKVQSTDGTVGYVSASSKYIKVTTTSTPTPTPAPVPAEPSVARSAKVVYGVNLRSEPSTSGKVITMLSKGTSLTILDQSNTSFYKVRTSDGRTGYVSTNDKYLSIEGKVQPTVPAPAPISSISRQIDQVVETGMKYLGTPYEYGSNRNTTTTFDCSDFIRHIFKETLGITLPADSRKQGDYIKDNGTAVYNINNLKRGDLVFFMSYKGSSAKSYQGINKSTARITHVALYLGDGKLLHTYSKESGGVKLDKLDGAWVHRFLYGGSVLK